MILDTLAKLDAMLARAERGERLPDDEIRMGAPPCSLPCGDASCGSLGGPARVWSIKVNDADPAADIADLADGAWPYGSGGACGPQFAAVAAQRRRDIERYGIVEALHRWITDGTQEASLLEVLSEKDLAKLDRLYPAPEVAYAAE